MFCNICYIVYSSIMSVKEHATLLKPISTLNNQIL